MQAELEEKAN